MKKVKKLLGVLLAIALIYSSVSFSITALEPQRAGAGSNAIAPFNNSEYRRPTPVVSLEATDIIRVGDESDSSMASGTTIKRATPSGVPFITGNFTSQAYAGEEPVWPSVSFSSSEKVNILSASVVGTGASATLTLVEGNTQNTNSARWEIQGGTANAGSYLKISIEYTYKWLNPYTGVYVTDTYVTTTQSYVENVIFPAGAWVFASAYSNVSNAADVRYVSRILGKGVYGAPIQLKSISGDYQSGHNNFADNLFYSTNGDIPERTMLKVDPPHLGWGDKYLANGVNPYSMPDEHRAKALIYLDTSVQTMESNNVRMHFFINGDHRSTNKARDLTYETIHVRNGDVAYTGSTGNVLGSSHAEALAALNPTGPVDGTTSTGGGFLHLGMETTSTLYGNGAAGQYTLVTQWTGKGDNGSPGVSANWMQYYHAVTIEIINISKQQLRAALNKSIGVSVKTVDGSENVSTILSSSGTDPNSGTISASVGKGKNPQEWYYSSGWSTYVAAYDNAWEYITKPNVAQAAANSTATALNNGYNGLALRKANYSDSASQYLASGLGNTYYGSNILPLDDLIDIVDNRDTDFAENLKDWHNGTYHYYTNDSRTALEEAYAAATSAQTAQYSVIYQPYVDYLAASLQDAIENLEYKEFTISFNGNGSTGGSMSSISVIPGTAFNLPLNGFVREGHTFLGWSLVKNGPVVYANGAGFTSGTEDVTLYAKWQLNNYTITFDANGGVGGTVTSLPYGSSLNPPTVTKTGHNFVEWLPVPPATVPAENAVYVAQWVKLSYTFTFDANGGTGGDSFTLAYGDPITPPEVERFGYIFDGWDPEVPQFAPAEDMIFTAKWTPKLYTVTFDANGGTGGTSYQLAYGDPLTPPPVEKPGYDHVGWDPAIPPTMPSENVTYTAVWSPKLYTMIFQANGGTFPEHGTNFYQVKMPFGSPLVAPLATRPGYDFVGWDPVLPDTVPNKNSVFTAKWKIAKTTVSFNLNGGTGLIPPSQTGDIGSPVTLPPRGDISKNGYNFLGWAPSSTATTPVTSYNFQATDSTLYAVWGLITYTVSFDLNGGSGTTPTSQTGTPGTNVSLPAQGNIQKPGYKFLGWAESSNATVPLNSYQISNSNSTLYAVWELITYTVSFDLNGGSGTTPSSQTGAPGTSVGLPAQGDITKVGYNFLGWAESADATEVLGSYQIGNADSTLYAVWELITYTVSFDLNGGSGTTPSSQTGVPGTAVVLPAQGDISREYFTFLGWAETADATEALAACQIGNANSILYAVWKKIPVTLTPQEGSDTKFGHSSAGDIIFGVAPGTTEEDFLNSYVGVTGHGELRFSENDGRFGTGRKVELVDLDTEEVLESYYIIIFGDVNGDGLVNQDDADLVKATAAFIGDLDLNTPYGFAADLNGDGVIDAFDFNIFKAALKGIRTISQNILVW